MKTQKGNDKTFEIKERKKLQRMLKVFMNKIVHYTNIHFACTCMSKEDEESHHREILSVHKLLYGILLVIHTEVTAILQDLLISAPSMYIFSNQIFYR